MGCSIGKPERVDPASPQKQRRVQLLPAGLPGKPAQTLAEAIPPLAVPRERKKK